MLTINKSYNGESAVLYFKEGLSKEGNYYLDGNVKAYWQGKTATSLGLHGKEVKKEDFSNLVHNIHPDTKEKLTVRNAENRRAGFDFTFSAPKSISVLHAITKDPAILEAHRSAYKAAMQEVEAEMQTQANTQSERGYENTGNIIYAPFDHFLGRPCEIQKNGKTLFISDPQLHTHCYMPNVTWSNQKQRYQALETGNIHRRAYYFETAYHAHLSKNLNEAGYQTQRTHERYEIQGVSRSIIERFSNRTKLIDQVAKEKGITDPKAKSELAVKTRHSKSKAVSKDQLYGHWKERLSKAEFEALHNIKGNKKETLRPVSAKEAIDRSLEHHLERNSVVEQERVLAHALTLGYGNLLPQDVRKELNIRDNILRSEVNTITHITTLLMVRVEDKMIELSTKGKGKFPALNTNYKPKQDFLNEQQRKAIKDILTSNDQVTILRGSAGVGKTSLLTEVKDGIAERGKSLFSVAPSSQASKVLKQKGFEADTIAGLLHNPKLQEKLHNNVLLVDEAGMCGVKTMSELLVLTKKHNARLLLSGDTKQHSSPEYGDAMRILQDKAKLKTVTVQKIMRQKPQEYRKVVEKLAAGRTLEGYQTLNKIGAVKEIPEHEERLNKIADDYVGSVTKNRSALIVSPTHLEGEKINETVREKLRAKGRIQGKDRSFDILKNLSFTNSQKKDLVNYSENQVIRFVKNQKGGFKAGSHYEVLPDEKQKDISVRDLKSGEIFKLPHDNPEHYQVYQRAQVSIAKGDLIRLTNNSKTLENTKANNGTTYQIKGFTKTGNLRLDNGKTLPKDIYHFKHGYSETSHSSQGKTAQDVFVSMSDLSFAATNEQAFYVATSRGTHSVSIYTSDKKELKNAIARSGERITAREIADDYERQLLQRKQRAHHRTLNEKLKEHGRTQKREKQVTRDISKESPGR
ncbi:MobF family relaxase [Fulvivirgaceae bacterium BMA12]|uniref:MobF family relaxase n=1 Tax=Agaribacillus aureus TaxID=3051825 RepID=A0ABT8LBA3_9BACT|nr:MobF family relaxase [Fulvivirgaceae bacterium BMA12]